MNQGELTGCGGSHQAVGIAGGDLNGAAVLTVKADGAENAVQIRGSQGARCSLENNLATVHFHRGVNTSRQLTSQLKGATAGDADFSTDDVSIGASNP